MKVLSEEKAKEKRRSISERINRNKITGYSPIQKRKPAYLPKIYFRMGKQTLKFNKN